MPLANTRCGLRDIAQFTYEDAKMTIIIVICAYETTTLEILYYNMLST